MTKGKQDIRFAKEHAGKLLLAAFVVPALISVILTAMAAPVGFMAFSGILGILLWLASFGGYAARRRRLDKE